MRKIDYYFPCITNNWRGSLSMNLKMCLCLPWYGFISKTKWNLIIRLPALFRNLAFLYFACSCLLPFGDSRNWLYSSSMNVWNVGTDHRPTFPKSWVILSNWKSYHLQNGRVIMSCLSYYRRDVCRLSGNNYNWNIDSQGMWFPIKRIAVKNIERHGQSSGTLVNCKINSEIEYL